MAAGAAAATVHGVNTASLGAAAAPVIAAAAAVMGVAGS
ncbi:hypothetical protein ABIA35_001057 [Catenulispora sp. MAP12-49]